MAPNISLHTVTTRATLHKKIITPCLKYTAGVFYHPIYTNFQSYKYTSFYQAEQYVQKTLCRFARKAKWHSAVRVGL